MTPESSPISCIQPLFPIPNRSVYTNSAFPCRFLASNCVKSSTISFRPPENGEVQHARRPFGKMPDQKLDVSSWSSLIMENTRCGNFSQSFCLFTELLKSGWRPDEFALGSLLKASSGLSDVSAGEQLHAKSIRTGLEAEPGMRTSLITMYSSCGQLEDARRIFDEVPPIHEGDVPSWNSIISAYVFHGQYRECFLFFLDMLGIGHLTPTDATYSSVISACASIGEIELGRVIHGMIIKDRMLDKTKLFNSLITLYTKCGNLEDAKKLFEVMDGKNIVSWNAVIAGHEQNGECEYALGLFCRLLRSERQLFVKPNRITFLSVLSAVSDVSALNLGREVHAQMIRSGLECETSIGNSIITMYGKCGDVVKGRLVFERLPCPDAITWNSVLAGYAQNKQLKNFYEQFREMQLLGIKPDNHTLTILLGAITSDTLTSSSFILGREIHGYVMRREAPRAVLVSAYNAILTMYAKNNKLGDAEKIFNGMRGRDSYSWNAMLDAYSMNGHYDNAVMLFVDKHKQGLQFDYLTFSILLTACSRSVSIKLGKQFHALTVKLHLHHQDSKISLLSINNALVSMYSKCGSVSDAARVFQRMRRRDVFSWTAIITAYAHHGRAYESIQFFERMKMDIIEPNSVTFLGLLTACAHAGLVEEGMLYFSSMDKESKIKPSIEHYACMVDLFGRSGQFERAENMVETAITQLGLKNGSCLSLWKVLFGACHAHKQLELGVRVATRIFEFEPEDETTHVLLSNLYASFGLWKDAITVRRSMKDRGLKKEAGCSWIEVGNRRHVFVAGDVGHPNRKEIYEKLEELDEKFRSIGYVPMTEYVLHDVDEVQKEAILSYHSEKLAVSFAILQTGTRKGIVRVIKNLRVCRDCHNWMKFASQVEGQEIVLRDSRRFHFFKDGKCSCGEYW